MNPITLQDLIDQTADYCQNFTSSTIDKDSTIRAINRGIEFVQRRLGLPSDEKVYSFLFYEDVKYYDCPNYFNELIEVYYNTAATVLLNSNVPINRWGVMKNTEILRDNGRYPQHNQVAFSTLNGKNQLLMFGKNIHGSSIVNSFDSVSGMTFSTDMLNTAIDNNILKQGSGSLKFDLNTSLSASTITLPQNLNIQSQLNNNTAYRVYVDFPTGTTGYFSNVELRFISSVGNYYTVNTTLQADGTAWTVNSWNLLSLPLSSATTVGTPVATNITSIQLIFNHSGSFAALTNMRVDYLYQVTPDLMDCVYYTAIKGTDTTGVTEKAILDTPSDIIAFGAYAPDLIDTVSLTAAVKLFPQIRGDATFWQMYKADVKDTLALLGRTFPHKRATGNFGQSQLNR